MGSPKQQIRASYVQSAAAQGVLGFCPPVYNGNGAEPSGGSGTMHTIILPNLSVGWPNAAAQSSTLVITLTGSSIFTGANTYVVSATPTNFIAGITSFPIPAVFSKSASGFSIAFDGVGAASSAQTLFFDLIATGW